jgi:hypothetical protein
MSQGPQLPPNLPVEDHSPAVDGRAASEPSSVLAIVSLVLSILSLPAFCGGTLVFPCCGMGVGGPMALAGAITGFIALQKVKAGTASGKGLAQGGMITGIVFVVLSIITVVVTILFFGGIAALSETSGY